MVLYILRLTTLEEVIIKKVYNYDVIHENILVLVVVPLRTFSGSKKN